MIYSVIPTDVIFYDSQNMRQRQIKMYNDLTLEISDGRVERIISTNPKDYLEYCHLLGSEKIE